MALRSSSSQLEWISSCSGDRFNAKRSWPGVVLLSPIDFPAQKFSQLAREIKVLLLCSWVLIGIGELYSD